MFVRNQESCVGDVVDQRRVAFHCALGQDGRATKRTFQRSPATTGMLIRGAQDGRGENVSEPDRAIAASLQDEELILSRVYTIFSDKGEDQLRSSLPHRR